MRIFVIVYVFSVGAVLVVRQLASATPILTAGVKFLWLLGPMATLLSDRGFEGTLVFIAETAVLIWLVWIALHSRRGLMFWTGIAVFWFFCGVLPYAAHV